MKTLLKIKNLHIWSAGSMVEPHAHIWIDYKHAYRGVNIFPNLKRSRVWTYESCTSERGLHFYQGRRFVYNGKTFEVDEGLNKGLAYWCISGGFSNRTPKWIQTLLENYDSWQNWSSQFWGDNINEDGTFDKTWIMPERPSFIMHIYQCWKRRQRIKNCNHDHMECDSHITGDSGSEDLHCPDCGFTDHIQYY